MKKLFTSILILISALTYSQNLSIEDLNIDTLNAHILVQMNHVRDSLIADYKYKTTQRYIKRKGKYVTDTLETIPVIKNTLVVNSSMNKAAASQASYMVAVNHTSHEQPRVFNGKVEELDTLLFDLLDRREYFNVEIDAEICQHTTFGYEKDGYAKSFTGMNIDQVYDVFSRAIVDQYLDSPGHRRILLTGSYNEVGISTKYINNARIFNTIVFE